MKKILLGLFTVLFCISVTGCGNADKILTCNQVTTDEDGYKTTDILEVTYNDEIVKSVKSTTIMEVDKDYIDFSYNLVSSLAQELNKIDGYSVEYTKETDNTLKSVSIIDYSKLDLDKLKTTLGDNFDESSYLAVKNININDFKEDNLKDYTCK